VIILRVDDRYIHGQVVAGWARPLRIEIIILASNKLSKDEWACNAYKLAIPEGIEFSCVNIKQCVTLVTKENKKKLMIVVGSVHEAHELLLAGLNVKEVNIGGVGYKEGTREITTYIYLTPDDIKSIVQLYEMGIKVTGKQLPNSPPVDVVKMLTGVK
jgi:mannose/fructose/N-acetylgalactosamine-specific phosphotransferase system component IIB